MSKKYPGGIIRGTPVTPTATSASGIWTLDQAQTYTKEGIWPRSPDAPTIGTATAGTANCASITFTAPTCTGSASITGYTLTSTPGCKTGTGASSPITVSGLTAGTSYTFKAKATNGAGTGPCSAASNSVTATIKTCDTYTTAGTYTWVAPTGVTSVAAVAVGAGFRGGGALAYRNGMAVTAGSSYTVIVPTAPYTACGPRCAQFTANAGVKVAAQSACRSSGSPGVAGSSCGTAKYSGGCGGYAGGGAGGYAGNGGSGQGSSAQGAGVAGSGGAGGGGGVYYCCGTNTRTVGAGGGVGLYGQGSNGAAGGTGNLSNGGGGGSGGTAGNSIVANGGSPSVGGDYGGGRGQSGTGSTPGKAAVRIVYCRCGARGTPSFPSTNVGP